MSLHETLKEEEVEKQQQRQAESIEQARLKQHNVLSQFLINVENPDLLSSPGPNLSDKDLLDRPEFNSDVPEHESEDNGSNDDVQYLRTQARFHSTIFPSSFSSRKSRHSSCNLTLSLEMNDSDLDELVDIDKLLSQQIPPPLVSLSQNLTTSQLPPSDTPIMTRTVRGVTQKKKFELQYMESQELKDAQAKIENERQQQARKKAANKKKRAKAKQPRKEDISQLELSNRFALLGSSPPEEK